MARVKNGGLNKPKQDKPKTKGRRSEFRAVKIGTRTIQMSERILREIKNVQRCTTFLIPKTAFSRLIREILQGHAAQIRDLKVQPQALEALQEAAEMYCTQLFEDGVSCTYHANRMTLRPNDIQLVLNLRKSI